MTLLSSCWFGPTALLLDPVISSCFVFTVTLPLLPSSSFFLSRFRTQGTVGNPCPHTMCFFSPRSSLVAPPKRLSPVRPVTRLDSPKGRVSNDRVPCHPTPSSRQTPFHPFSRWSAILQVLCHFATPVQVARTHRITRRTIFVSPHSFHFVLCSTALRFHRVPMHTGN